MYFTRIITITAVASVAVATCGLAASTLSFDYTSSHGAHQELVRRDTVVSIPARGSHIQPLDRHSSAKAAVKQDERQQGEKRKIKKSGAGAASLSNPTAAPGSGFAAPM